MHSDSSATHKEYDDILPQSDNVTHGALKPPRA